MSTADLAAALKRIAELEVALADLIDAASSRVPGDEAGFASDIEDARAVLPRTDE